MTKTSMNELELWLYDGIIRKMANNQLEMVMEDDCIGDKIYRKAYALKIDKNDSENCPEYSLNRAIGYLDYCEFCEESFEMYIYCDGKKADCINLWSGVGSEIFVKTSIDINKYRNNLEVTNIIEGIYLYIKFNEEIIKKLVDQPKNCLLDILFFEKVFLREQKTPIMVTTFQIKIV